MALALWQEYFIPETLPEALAILGRYGGAARVIAGGTDLILQLRKKEVGAAALVDLTRLAELRYIREEEGLIKIGALTTHDELANSGLLREKAAVLAQAAASVGSPQIRKVGTVGGNLVNAQPAADTAVALLALDAHVRIVGPEGEREQPLAALYAGVGQSTVDPTREIVAEIAFAIPSAPAGSAFERLAKRKALALPILNAAAVVALDEDKKRCRQVRIAVAPVAPAPWRAEAAEAELAGKELDEETIRRAAEAAAAQAQPRDSKLRGSAAYRKEMVKVLVARALRRAAQAGGASL